MTKPKLMLKSFKVYEKISEETLAFSARVYFNGKLVGDAKNSGTGGPDELRVNNNERKEIEAYLKEKGFGEDHYEGPVGDFLEKMVEKGHIKELVKKHKKKGVVVLYDPNTGRLFTQKVKAKIYGPGGMVDESVKRHIRESLLKKGEEHYEVFIDKDDYPTLGV